MNEKWGELILRCALYSVYGLIYLNPDIQYEPFANDNNLIRLVGAHLCDI